MGQFSGMNPVSRRSEVVSRKHSSEARTWCLRLRKHRRNRFREPLEAVHAGDEHIRHGPVLQPKLRSLGVVAKGPRPKPQHLLVALHVDANDRVDRLVAHLARLANLTINASKYTIGYTESNGRFCRLLISSITAL